MGIEGFRVDPEGNAEEVTDEMRKLESEAKLAASKKRPFWRELLDKEEEHIKREGKSTLASILERQEKEKKQEKD